MSVPHDLDLAPPDSACIVCSLQRLVDGLFGGDARGDMARRRRLSLAVGTLGGSEQAGERPIAVPVQHAPNALHRYQVDPYSTRTHCARATKMRLRNVSAGSCSTAT